MICLGCDNLMERKNKNGGGQMFCIIDKSKIHDLLNLVECSKFKKREEPPQDQGGKKQK